MNLLGVITRVLRRRFAGLLGPKSWLGARRTFLHSHVEPLHERLSGHDLAKFLAGHRVRFVGEDLTGDSVKIDVLNIPHLDFCRLFILFNGARAGEYANLRRTSYGTPVGFFVLSLSESFALEEVRVGLYAHGWLAIRGFSLFIAHLVLNRELAPRRLGGMAVSLSIVAAYKSGMRYVDLYADRAGQIGNRPPLIGYAFFPKLGFDASLTDAEMNDPEFDGCRTIQDVRDKLPGVWEARGSGRLMRFDLTPSSRSWMVLIKYCGEKFNGSEYHARD